MPDAPFSTGILFIKTRDHNGNDLVAYYQHNHLQAPLQAIDKQGNIRWAAQYTAFGQTSIISSGDSAINSNLRLPGQYADSESGLYYNWQRYYDANTGRYISSDPIGLTGGFNRYAYVGGNPVGWVDPSGLNAAIPVVLAAICLRNPAGCRAGATILFCMAFPSLCTPPDPVNNAEPYKKDEADGEYCPEDDEGDDCDALNATDTSTCNGITRVRGARAGAACHASASERYGACLAGRPISPLNTWNN